MWRRILLIVALLLHHKIHGLVDREAARLLTRWELLECCKVLTDDCLRRNQYKRVLNEPFVISACLVFGTLERIGAQIEYLRRAQRD